MRYFPLIFERKLKKFVNLEKTYLVGSLHLTFHVARHTFAKTVALKNGIPLETVQIMMGHTKITTTQIYADVDEEKVSTDMAGLEEKIQKKRDFIISNQETDRLTA